AGSGGGPARGDPGQGGGKSGVARSDREKSPDSRPGARSGLAGAGDVFDGQHERRRQRTPRPAGDAFGRLLAGQDRGDAGAVAGRDGQQSVELPRRRPAGGERLVGGRNGVLPQTERAGTEGGPSGG